MPGLPTLRAWLEDASGAFTLEISEFVRLSGNVGTTRGRQDEFDDVDPTEVQLRLDNRDGRFTLGSATYGIRVDQRLRLQVSRGGSSFTATGRVQSWPTAWDGPLGNLAFAQVTVIDDQARLARLKLDSMYQSEVRSSLTPGSGRIGYWPMDEAAPARSAGERSGSGFGPLRRAGSGTAVTFGTTSGPPWISDESLAPIFAGEGYLVGSVPDTVKLPGLAAFVRTDTRSCRIMRYQHSTDTVVSVGIDGDGLVSIRLRLSPFSDYTLSLDKYIADAKLHHVALTMFPYSPGSDTIYVALLVDGIELWSTADNLDIAGGSLEVGRGLVGSISHLVVGSGSTALSAAALFAAGMTGFAGETAGARTARIARYSGLTATSDAQTVLAGQQFLGSSAWDLFAQVANSEGGRLYLGQTGAVVLRSRQAGWTAATSTPALTTDVATVDDNDLVVTGDKTYLKNRVTGTRTEGAQQVVDSPTIATYGVYEADLGTLLLQTDQEVLDRVQWVANVYGEISPRLSTVTIDLLVLPTAQQQAVLGIEIGSRILVTGMPSQAPSGSLDLMVEGWTETVSQNVWRRTFTTTPANLQQVVTLDSDPFGALDTYLIGY